MKTPQSSKRRRPKGKPLPRTDAQIDALAGGVPTSDELAELIARTAAVSPLLERLMQAEDTDDGADRAGTNPA